MKASIDISLNKGILDPQSKAIKNALDLLGFKDISDVHISKKIIIELKNETSKKKALSTADKMCNELLANTIIEDYVINIE